MKAGIDFSDLIPSALALALEIDRIHAIADGKALDDCREKVDGENKEDDEGSKSIS